MRGKSRNDLFLDDAPLSYTRNRAVSHHDNSKFMPKVTLLPGGQSAEVPADTLLLDAGEKAGVEMEAGCFNCSCGTCAVAIASGMENLDPPTDEELNVLDQWNKDPEKYRLTCCVKIQKGEVVIRLEH
jgi:ferredoxin